MNLHQTVENAIRKSLMQHWSEPSQNTFDLLMEEIQKNYEAPVHNLAEIRAQANMVKKGRLFEIFALKYFQTCFQPRLTDVWLLEDVPADILDGLHLKRRDVGIDLIGRDEKGDFYAIQAKYRQKKFKRIHGVTWRDLSTFHALANKTGPFVRHIVFTNANFVRHMGAKTARDLSICYGTLSKISDENWTFMAGSIGHRLDESTVKQEANPDDKHQDEKELLRQRRLKYFS